MAYITYGGLKSPNEVLQKIAEYISGKGYTIVEPIMDDLDIYNSATAITDGKRFVFKDKTDSYFISLRSANGYGIFGSSNDEYMETLESSEYQSELNYGIGMVVSEGYSRVARWYNQFKVPIKKGDTEVLGCYIPVSKEDSGNAFTLYCNNITAPSDILMFTVERENAPFRGCVHLLVGSLTKYASWTGGIIFSGSANRYTAEKSAYLYMGNSKTQDCCLLPLLGSSYDSNTFLRIDIDDAPSIKRGSIYWASSGLDNITGKRLLMPVRGYSVSVTKFKLFAVGVDYAVGDIIDNDGKLYKVLKGFTGAPSFPYIENSNKPEDNKTLQLVLDDTTNLIKWSGYDIPSYNLIQSFGLADWGKNVNTLNCITTNMPIYASVLVDPDVLQNYAPAGYLGGIYFVSTLNMQVGSTYEINYPTSGDICQVFPLGRRRGVYGFDGLSIKQEIAP